MLFDFPLKAALPDEKALFYSGESEILPRIGYIRADFGSSGEEFWHSWNPGEATAFNTPEFRAEFHVLMECLRTDLLSSREGMRQYLREHPGLLLEDSYLKVIGYRMPKFTVKTPLSFQYNVHAMPDRPHRHFPQIAYHLLHESESTPESTS